MNVEVSNARRDGDKDQDQDLAQVMRELDEALSLLVDAQDDNERLRIERDTARRIAVACENDERRSKAESDEAIKLLLERDVGRLQEIESLTVRNAELERLLASRQAG
jgi:hypothetical protein